MSKEELSDNITIDQSISFGKPCIKGTRIAISDILEWLSDGLSIPGVLEDFIA